MNKKWSKFTSRCVKCLRCPSGSRTSSSLILLFWRLIWVRFGHSFNISSPRLSRLEDNSSFFRFLSFGKPLRFVMVELLRSRVSRLANSLVKHSMSMSPPVFTPLRSRSRTCARIVHFLGQSKLVRMIEADCGGGGWLMIAPPRLKLAHHHYNQVLSGFIDDQMIGKVSTQKWR